MRSSLLKIGRRVEVVPDRRRGDAADIIETQLAHVERDSATRPRPISTCWRASAKKPSPISSPKTAETRRGPKASGGLARKTGQDRVEAGPHEPDQPNRRHGLWLVGDDHRPGGRRRRGSHADRAARRQAGDRMLSRQPGRRFRQAGPEGGGEGRELPLHPLWHDVRDCRARSSDAIPEPEAQRAGGRRRPDAAGQDIRRRERTQNLCLSRDA